MKRAWLVLAPIVALAACDWELHRMNDQPRCEPMEVNPAVPGDHCDRPPPPRLSGRALIARGGDRFARFCATCHGELGTGQSQVAENMTLRPPPSLHEPRIVALPDERIERTIREGYGLMPGYRYELPAEDRRAVVEFLRVLQLSQDVQLDRLPPHLQQEARRWLP
ncbi:MAG: cytochrome c [Deltaproteobacteria bacterium]|nr:cytochrome c [Kofleriaceae bacterium]